MSKINRGRDALQHAQFQRMLNESDRYLWQIDVAGEWKISIDSLSSVVYKNLHIHKLCAQFMTESLSDEQKHYRMKSLKILLIRVTGIRNYWKQLQGMSRGAISATRRLSSNLWHGVHCRYPPPRRSFDKIQDPGVVSVF